MIIFKALVMKHSLVSAQPCRCHCFFDLLLSLLSLLLGDVIEIEHFVIACRAMAGPGNCSRICAGFHSWIINLKGV